MAAGLAGALASADLVDEYRLLVQPLVWAADRPCSTSFWSHGTLGLVDATQLPSGIVVHVYRPRTPESEDP